MQRLSRHGKNHCQNKYALSFFVKEIDVYKNSIINYCGDGADVAIAVQQEKFIPRARCNALNALVKENLE